MSVTDCHNGRKLSARHQLHLQNSDDSRMARKRVSPWAGQIELPHLRLFPLCRLQVVLKNAADGMIGRIFLLSLDLEDMPMGSKTIVRQTSFSHTLDSEHNEINTHLAHLVQFGIRRDRWSGKIFINSRIRIVATLTKAAVVVKSKNSLVFPTGVEEYLEVVTEWPDNPKYYLDAAVPPPALQESEGIPIIR